MRSLAEHDAFEAFEEWLQGSLDETRELNDDLEGIALTRSQGKAKTLSEIIAVFQTALRR